MERTAWWLACSVAVIAFVTGCGSTRGHTSGVSTATVTVPQSPTATSSNPSLRLRLPALQEKQLRTLGTLLVSVTSSALQTERACIGLGRSTSFFAADDERACVVKVAATIQKALGVAEQATRDSARSVRGPCRERLLDYLGAGGTGDALETSLRFAAKHASNGEAAAFRQVVTQRARPALKANRNALLAAERVC